MVSAAGEPIPGAPLVLMRVDDDGSPFVDQLHGNASLDGAFRVAIPDSSIWRLFLDFSSDSEVEVRSGDNAIALEAPGHHVPVRITDNEGRPISAVPRLQPVGRTRGMLHPHSDVPANSLFSNAIEGYQVAMGAWLMPLDAGREYSLHAEVSGGAQIYVQERLIAAASEGYVSTVALTLSPQNAVMPPRFAEASTQLPANVTSYSSATGRQVCNYLLGRGSLSSDLQSIPLVPEGSYFVHVLPDATTSRVPYSTTLVLSVDHPDNLLSLPALGGELHVLLARAVPTSNAKRLTLLFEELGSGRVVGPWHLWPNLDNPLRPWLWSPLESGGRMVRSIVLPPGEWRWSAGESEAGDPRSGCFSLKVGETVQIVVDNS